MSFGNSEPGVMINLTDSQVDLSLSQITETIIDISSNCYADDYINTFDDQYANNNDQPINSNQTNNMEKDNINNIVSSDEGGSSTHSSAVTCNLLYLEEDLNMLKDINSDMKSLNNNVTYYSNLNDLENIDLNKLVESTINVDEEIIKEQNKEIKKVEQDLNELKEIVNVVNKIVVINKEDLEIVEQSVEKAEADVTTGIQELTEASTYVNWLTHKNTKITGAATIVGLTSGGVGYLLGAGVIVASGIAVAAGVATGTGTKVALKSISQKFNF
jgi:hypothetical protein